MNLNLMGPRPRLAVIEFDSLQNPILLAQPASHALPGTSQAHPEPQTLSFKLFRL